MDDERRTDTNKILKLQSDTMTAIFEYQLKYGVEALSWNMNIQFHDKVVT